jgi:hypothetical protein
VLNPEANKLRQSIEELHGSLIVEMVAAVTALTIDGIVIIETKGWFTYLFVLVRGEYRHVYND